MRLLREDLQLSKLFATHKHDGHQRKRNDGHCCTYRKIDSEIHILHHEIGYQQQSYSHGAGNKIVFPDVSTLADYTAKVGNPKGYETDRTAD